MFANIMQNTFTAVSFLIKLLLNRHQGFPVDFAKFLRTPILLNSSRLLMKKIMGLICQSK